MKTRLLFLVKLVGYSLLLFALWRPVTDAYVVLLNHLAGSLNNVHNFVGRGLGKLISEMFVYLIPFVSLILATPGIRTRRKLIVLVCGTICFLLSDTFLIEYVIYNGGIIREPESSAFIALYHNFKWLFPFLFWFLLCYPYMGTIFRLQKNRVLSATDSGPQ